MQRLATGLFAHDPLSDRVRTGVSLFLKQKTDYASYDICSSLPGGMRVFNLFNLFTKVELAWGGLYQLGCSSGRAQCTCVPFRALWTARH